MDIRILRLLRHNNQIQYAAIFAATLLLGYNRTIAAESNARLEPEQGYFGFVPKPYDEAVGERLLSSTKYRKCQAVFMPSFHVENAVYMKMDDDHPTALPLIVSARFEKQLWYQIMTILESAADSNGTYSVAAEAKARALAKTQSVIICREAPIDRETANILETVWNAMLMRVRPPEESTHGFDGETIHFANFEQGIGYRTGMVWSPDEGTETYEFTELARSLQKYTGLPESDRKMATEALVEKANKLLRRLNVTSNDTQTHPTVTLKKP